MAAVSPALEFEDLGGGRFRLTGHLGFDTANYALSHSHGLFADHKRIQLDLSGIGSTDSAGLALLIEWTGWARREKRKLTFTHVPEQALALAKISEVDKLLPVG
ncbi:MAG TPA: STAS domain-containing protein [Gammaproteobacteria bacterium]|nr:STAS domain-containing protein [Gammaproteobacteria bacterium]